jgi:malate synthase
MEMNTITNELASHYLDKDFYKFLARLESYGFSRRQKRLARDRLDSLVRSREGRKPEYRDVTKTSWQAKLPDWMRDQRNQMTGPASDAKLCVKMINSRSPGVMLDLEDSMANTGDILLGAHDNVKLALRGQLGWQAKADDLNSVVMMDKDSPSVIFTRIRGLHMGQIIPNKVRTNHYVSASLFDLAYHFYDMKLDKLKHPPCIYIPKSENMQEAMWWRNVFMRIEMMKRWPLGTIKCMALVESHSLAYEIEDFATTLQPYLVGLNLGRWDYMASFIDHNYNDILFPDRNSIPTDVGFFQNLRHRMAQVCHSHGMLAIGGMTALYPSRKDPELNEMALSVLDKDKKNEAACLMDGAWTGHPDQNEIAVAAFPEPNQLNKLPGEKWLTPDLRDFPELDGLKVTEEGTREAIRTCIQYRQGVLDGRGASLINGYMEDLATDRIYRIMIAQRIDHGVHTEEEVELMFADELQNLYDADFVGGAEETLRLIKTRQFNPR